MQYLEKAMMVRRTSFLQAGGFSEEVEDRYKDVDLCLKLEQLGLNNVYDPGVILLCQGRTLQKKKRSGQQRFSVKVESAAGTTGWIL